MDTGSKTIAAAKMKQEYTELEMLPIYVLALVDTNMETDIHISDHLIHKRLAEMDPTDPIEISSPLSIPLLSPSPTTPFPLAVSYQHFLPTELSNIDAPPLYTHSQASSPRKSTNYISNVSCTEAIGGFDVKEEKSYSPLPPTYKNLALIY